MILIKDLSAVPMLGSAASVVVWLAIVGSNAANTNMKTMNPIKNSMES